MKERITWIDDLKGLAMLSVVLYHIYGEDTVVGKFLGSYQLPLFFFLSGYILKNTDNYWDLLKRISKFIFPCVIIGYLFSCLKGLTPIDFLFAEMKVGYWYLWVLSEFYLLFYLIDNYTPHKLLSKVIIVLIIWGAFKFCLADSDIHIVGLLSAIQFGNYWIFFSSSNPQPYD